MNLDYLTYALLGGLAIGLLISVYTDVRYRMIYNKVTLPIALAAPIYWYATGDLAGWSIPIHLVTAIGVFAFFALFFSFGMMGGGDVKLFAALALWFSWTKIITMVLVASLLGGAVTIAFFAVHKLRKKKGAPRIPYGVAISLAGLWAISEPFFNHFG